LTTKKNSPPNAYYFGLFFASFLFFCFLPISAQISTDERKYTVIRFGLSKIGKHFLQKISDIAIFLQSKAEFSSKNDLTESHIKNTFKNMQLEIYFSQISK
jgi:hypothetical protein